jgi:hypothetical protein
MIAYLVNPFDRTIKQIEPLDWSEFGDVVGGTLSLAARWSTGDVLYVDDEGFHK